MNPIGSTADIHTFLSRIPPRIKAGLIVEHTILTSTGEQSSLPQSPWTVSQGSYTRTDGTILSIQGPNEFHGKDTQPCISESVEGLSGNEDVREGANNGVN